MTARAQLAVCPAFRVWILTFISTAAIGQPQATPSSRMSADVARIYQGALQGNVPNASPTLAPDLQSKARFDAQGRLQVKVNFDCKGEAPLGGLKTAGLVITTTVKVPPMCVVEGHIRPSALTALSAVSGVTAVDLPVYSVPHPPRRPLTLNQPNGVQGFTQGVANTAIDGSAVVLMHADQFISNTTINGSGVTVGVMSGDASHAAAIQAAGELPQNITLYASSANPSPTDEGTVMLEEIHAVAPGAALAFCGPQSETEFVSCLQSLIAGGAHVVVDDIAYFDDVMSNQGAFAQAIHLSWRRIRR